MKRCFFWSGVLLLAGSCSFEAKAQVEERQVIAVAMMKAAAAGTDEQWHMWRYPGYRPTQADGEGRHQIAAPMYPLIGPYDVSDRHYQEYMIHCLRMCGVDVVSLWWPGASDRLEYLHSDGATLTLREVRQGFAHLLSQTGIRACLRGGYDDEADLDDAQQMLGAATWQIKNRPVVMWFTPPKEEQFGAARISAWKAAQPLSPWMPQVLLDITDERYRPAAWADSTYAWIGRLRGSGAVFETGEFGQPPAHYTHMVRSDVAGDEHLALEQMSVLSLGLTHHWAAVSPGFDDRAVGAWGRRTRDGKRSLTGVERSSGKMHHGTQTYEQRWAAVIRDETQRRVIIPTWDDWNEGSQIEPSVEDGIACLEVTRRSVAAFKRLEQLPSSKTSLLLPVHLYRLRKAAAHDAARTRQLDQLAHDLLRADTPTAYFSVEQEVERLITESFSQVHVSVTRYWPLKTGSK
jgi:hypothetical protein